MKAPNYLNRASLCKASLFVAIATTSTNCLTTSAWAQLIEPPPDLPAPQSTTGGSTRPIEPTCLRQPKQSAFTALASLNSVGLTLHERPTVWVYVPPTYAKTLEFSLFDQNRKGIYQTLIEINDRTGYVPITLPSSAPALNQNQPYYWTVALVCDNQERTNDWITGGWIQQRSMNPDLQRRLTQTTLAEQIRLAAKAGYWYEAVDIYLRSQSAHPTDSQLSTVWAGLLETGKLQGFLSKANETEKRPQ